MQQSKTWEEMSDLEQAQATYWDMYKDAYGVRPRWIDTTQWTLEDFEAEFASEVEAYKKRELEDKAKAKQKREALKLKKAEMKKIIQGKLTKEELKFIKFK